MNDIKLVEYANEKNQLVELIKQFWLCHNQTIQTQNECLQDVENWTKRGHQVYFIVYQQQYIGFVHLGNRGGEIDWLEHLFVQPKYQNKGIGTQVIQLVEEIVKQYSISLYIEAASRNEKVIRLYRRLGYDCLNTISIRKDFNQDDLECVRHEQIYDLDFEIRKVKND